MTTTNSKIVNENYFSMDSHDRVKNFKMAVYEETVTSTKEGDCYTRTYLKDYSWDGSTSYNKGDIATLLKKGKWQYSLHSFNGNPSVRYVNGSRTYHSHGVEVIDRPWIIWPNGSCEVSTMLPTGNREYRAYKLSVDYSTNHVIMNNEFGYYEHETGIFVKSHGNEPCFIDFSYRDFSKHMKDFLFNKDKHMFMMVPIILLNGKKAWIDSNGIFW